MRTSSLSLCLLLLSADAARAQEPAEPGADVYFELGDGLVVESGDDQFGLAIRPRVQLRGELEADSSGAPEDRSLDEDDLELALLVRRARVVFAGWFFGKKNRFKLELAISPADVGFEPGIGPTRTPLLDWYVDFRHLRDLELRAGQYKLPYNRQRVISSGDLQMVDRSLANAELTIDRDFAVELRSRDLLGLDAVRYYAGIAAGEGRDAGFINDLKFFYYVRLELLPLGRFEDYDEVDFARSPRPRVSIGTAYAFLDDAPRLRGTLGPVPADGGTTDYHTALIDVFFKWYGFTFFSEVIGRNGVRNPGDALDEAGLPVVVPPPRNGIGWFAQAGYLLPTTDLEVAGRYGQLHPVGEDTGFPVEGELGAAVSYYFGQHSFKVQLDYFHFWSEGDFWNSEEQVRLQLQAAL